MPKFNPAAGQVVADELRSSFDSLDVAVYDRARLFTTFLETIRGSDLPPSRSQRALLALEKSLQKSLGSRGDLINAQRAMVAIKADSNLDVYDFGCWMGGIFGAAKEVPARAEADAA